MRCPTPSELSVMRLRRAALGLVIACAIPGWAAIPEGYRQVWEVAGRGATAAALPLLLRIIEKEPTFVPAYKTLGQIFVRSRDEAGLLRVLAHLDQRFKPLALAEYYYLRWSPQDA